LSDFDDILATDPSLLLLLLLLLMMMMMTEKNYDLILNTDGFISLKQL